jgi:mono/diheme cytochrome c family protein
MINAKKFILLFFLIISSALLFAAVGDGLWMIKVPDKARARQNPFAGEPIAMAAGAKLFRQNCASCHGDDATGVDNHPSLHSQRVRAASPGELEWLLKNGSMRNGMPSWSRLPEQQRWQIVSYLKSLQ